ncbi:MAG: hypothetical protein ABI763_07980 [Bacteroidota bacterium]
MRKDIFIFLFCILQLMWGKLFAQKVDRRDLLVEYDSGLFLSEDTAIENDSIIVVNSGISNIDDTFIVVTKKISSLRIDVHIYSSSLNLLIFYNSYKRMKEGEAKEYFESGELKSLGGYHRGKRISSEIGYFKNGTLNYISGLDNKNRSGTNVFFFPNGNISGETFFTDTSLSPITMSYYENGGIKDEIYGLMENENYIEFYASGKLKSEGHILKFPDFPNGKKVEYYENGKIMSIKYYQCVGIDSLPVGEWIFFDEKGKEVKRVQN